MSKFHPLRVHKIIKETEDAVSVEFELPDNIKSLYAFKSGQYLTFKHQHQGKEIRRSYSICSAPHENRLKVGIKEVPNGVFSTYANRILKEGDLLETMVPMGNFSPTIDAKNQKHYVLFAAGSGITPMLSIAKEILHKEPSSTVALFFGNKTMDSILFKEPLEGLKNTYTNRFVLHHILSRSFIGNELNRGRLNAEKCALLSTTILSLDHTDEFFICGPFEMIMGIKEWLVKKGISSSKVHFELFGVPDKKTVPLQTNSPQNKKGCAVTIIKDGDKMQFTLKDPSQNILDAAYELGMDIPFSCKGGVCCTCRAKVLEGKATMHKNFALEKEEVDNGYTLTCQAIPSTEKIVVSFDD